MKAVFGLSVGTIALLVPLCPAADMGLSSAGTPYAPTEVSKNVDTAVGPLSDSDRQDLLKEFKGLVAMGMHADSYDHWSGKSMADCYPPENRSEHWSHRCEIITAQCNGFYYFYPNESRQAATLQEVEVKVHASESEFMDELRYSLRSLFGREHVVEAHSLRLVARGPVRQWKTSSDIADLFMDISENPAGLVRFVWKRSPLAGEAEARAQETDTASARISTDN